MMGVVKIILVRAKSYLRKFFVLGQFWFFVHVSLLSEFVEVLVVNYLHNATISTNDIISKNTFFAMGKIPILWKRSILTKNKV